MAENSSKVSRVTSVAGGYNALHFAINTLKKSIIIFDFLELYIVFLR